MVPISNENRVGLSRNELEWEAKWMTRRMSTDHEKLPQQIMDIVITLIDNKNNEFKR